jgi:hypothetical protein
MPKRRANVPKFTGIPYIKKKVEKLWKIST